MSGGIAPPDFFVELGAILVQPKRDILFYLCVYIVLIMNFSSVKTTQKKKNPLETVTFQGVNGGESGI